MRALIILLLSGYFSLQVSSQINIAGIWKINESKKLFLLENKSFNMTSGNKLYEGTYFIDKNEKQELQLNLIFTKGTKTYVIRELHETSLQLYNPKKDMVLNMVAIQRFNTTKEQFEETPKPKKENTKPAASTVPISQKVEKEQDEIVKYKSTFDPFDQGKTIVNVTYGLIDYIDDIPEDVFNSSQPISLLLEKSIVYRIGFGARLGYRSWSVPESDLKLTLYSLSPRLTYHPEISKKIDLYAGAAASLRYATIKGGGEKAGRFTYGFTPVVGGRFYLVDRLALTGEFAYDASSNVNLGIAIALY